MSTIDTFTPRSGSGSVSPDGLPGRPAMSSGDVATQAQAACCVEDVEVRGHIIDSLILPKILDCITRDGGTFRIKEIAIGQAPTDSSRALIEVGAADDEVLGRILAQIANHGAAPTAAQDCQLVAADVPGAFPEDFYSTTNQRTEVRLGGRWLPVRNQAMDSAILVEPDRHVARCVRLNQVREGDAIVVGHAGVRVFPEERARGPHPFEFMGSNVSTEKPKGVAIRRVAEELVRNRASGGKTLVVAGPAVVHTDSGQFLCQLIRQGYVDLLFAGNALATHDIEQALFGTSLGVYLDRGSQAEAGHAHHLRAINRIRRLGGIQRAVDLGVLTGGIMFECIRHGIDVVLAGSIRDDGPLPEVITDAVQAQILMRDKLQSVTFCLMLATTLHSVAVGNLLPAWVKVVCVDINPSTAVKLADRGSFQTVALVTDVAPFLRALTEELAALTLCPAG